MPKPDTRQETIDLVADWLHKWAAQRHVAAIQCSPGSDQRNYGQQVAKEVAALAEEVRRLL